MRSRIASIVFWTAALAAPSLAADWPESGRVVLRQHDRGAAEPCRVAGSRLCVRPPVPTNSPHDPTYVGSSYGLGHPSYYGTPPALGIR